jgi:hypothetical protein
MDFIGKSLAFIKNREPLVHTLYDIHTLIFFNAFVEG